MSARVALRTTVLRLFIFTNNYTTSALSWRLLVHNDRNR
jgi:hypothetical protein